MINYIKYKNILLKGICSLGLLSMVVNGGGMDLEEIRKVTNGKGVFPVAVTNNGKYGTDIDVFAHLTNPPPGYEYLGLAAYSRKKPCVWIEGNTTQIIEVPLPLLSPHGWDDLEQYDNIDNLLPIPWDSEVVVEVRNLSSELEFGFEFQYRYQSGGNKSKRQPRGFKKAFEAQYLAGTRLLKLPEPVQISINYENPVEFTDYSQPIYSFPESIKDPKSLSCEERFDAMIISYGKSRYK